VGWDCQERMDEAIVRFVERGRRGLTCMTTGRGEERAYIHVRAAESSMCPCPRDRKSMDVTCTSTRSTGKCYSSPC